MKFMEANMEKRSPLFYVGLFVFVILAILSFSAGTLLTVFFIEGNSPTLFIEIGLSNLGAVVFMVSYFVNTFAYPPPIIVSQNQIKTYCLGGAIFFIWSTLLLGLLILSILKSTLPIHGLLIAISNYGFSGMLLAWVSRRIKAMKKI
jgi:hypothetical protein